MIPARVSFGVVLLLWSIPAHPGQSAWPLWFAALAWPALPRLLESAPLLLFRARPLAADAYPGVHRQLRGLARRAGLCPPRLYLIPSDTPNAFVCGGPGPRAALALTRGLLQLLSPQERLAVMAHEFGHLEQRRRHRRPHRPAAALLAGLARSALVKSAGAGAMRHALARALILAHQWLGHRATTNARELAADRYAARLCGDPRRLGDALRKIEAWQYQNRPPGAPRESGDWSGHPPVQERIRRLEALAYGAYL